MSVFSEIDYLVIGHLTVDLLPADENGIQKKVLGGTAAYAALTAHAMGLRVGVVSGWAKEISLAVLDDIELALVAAEQSTTFENIYLPEGRKQIVHAVAEKISLDDVPEEWRNVPVVHFAPVVKEIDTTLMEAFSSSKRYMTLQGMMREWNEKGEVTPLFWQNDGMLELADAVVFSIEDVQNDVDYIKNLSKDCPLLIVTHGKNGAVVYNNEEETFFVTDAFNELDPTGAGDIFAACFFCCDSSGYTFNESVAIAQKVAGYSVTQKGMQSILTYTEIMEIINEVQHG